MTVPQINHSETYPTLASFLLVIIIVDTLPPNPRCYIAFAMVYLTFGRVAEEGFLFLSRSSKFPDSMNFPLREVTGFAPCGFLVAGVSTQLHDG